MNPSKKVSIKFEKRKDTSLIQTLFWEPTNTTPILQDKPNKEHREELNSFLQTKCKVRHQTEVFKLIKGITEIQKILSTAFHLHYTHTFSFISTMWAFHRNLQSKGDLSACPPVWEPLPQVDSLPTLRPLPGFTAATQQIQNNPEIFRTIEVKYFFLFVVITTTLHIWTRQSMAYKGAQLLAATTRI